MGNGKNLPQHGNLKPSPQHTMLKDFTEKNLRRPLAGLIHSRSMLFFDRFETKPTADVAAPATFGIVGFGCWPKSNDTSSFQLPCRPVDLHIQDAGQESQRWPFAARSLRLLNFGGWILELP